MDNFACFNCVFPYIISAFAFFNALWGVPTDR